MLTLPRPLLQAVTPTDPRPRVLPAASGYLESTTLESVLTDYYISCRVYEKSSMATASKTLFPGVAVVTGAGGTGMFSEREGVPIVALTHLVGIGAAVAKAFAAAGCSRIAITDLNKKTLQQTRQEIANTHPEVHLLALAGDIADDMFAEGFIDKVVQSFGRVDYAVNCAGVLGLPRPSGATTLAEFDRVNNINYRGCWLSSRAQLRQMVGQEALPSHDPSRPAQRGSIVNIASQLGIVGRPEARKSLVRY